MGQMQIGVALRLVPDASGDLDIAEGGQDIDREWVDLKLNEFDDQALEEALTLKENTGAAVIAFAFDGVGADRLLQSALARGADRVIKLRNPFGDGLRARAAARLLAPRIRELGLDLVFAGVLAIDEIHGQLAPFLGATLDWPHVSVVSEIRCNDGALLARQETDGGFSTTLRVGLPAVIGVQTASRPIRYASGAKLRQFIGQKIALTDSNADCGDLKTELVRLEPPPSGGGAVMWEGDAEQVAEALYNLLVERGLAKGTVR
jgi:electron transfer flavoprotein beta subunit